MRQTSRYLILLVCIYGVYAVEIVSSAGKDVKSSSLYVQPDGSFDKTSEYYTPDLKETGSESLLKMNAAKLQNPVSTNFPMMNSVRVPKMDSYVPKKTPRGFYDFVSDYNDRYGRDNDEENIQWSPYTVAGRNDYESESRSSPAWNIRQNAKPSVKNTDFKFPGFSPDYTDIMMMMDAMKKMDNAASNPGLLTNILDNPITLVMATFIPLSLILSAALPLLVNVMMNGITIPALIQTTAGKARNSEPSAAAEVLLPLIATLSDLGTKYLGNPDCLHRVLCEAATQNSTERSSWNYVKHAVDAAFLVINDEMLLSLGLQPLVVAIKDAKCHMLPCSVTEEKSRLKLTKLMNDVMHNHILKTEPKIYDFMHS